MKLRHNLIIHKIGGYYRHVVVLGSRFVAGLLVSLKKKLDKLLKKVSK